MRNNARTLFIQAGIGFGAMAMLVGCAHTNPQEKALEDAQRAATQVRLEETERENGRLVVRVEELEDQVFLLQDRVEANRIALQRRGYMRGASQYAAKRGPAPSPESHYGSQGYGGSNGNDVNYNNAPPAKRRQVTRIPLGGSYEPDHYAEPLGGNPNTSNQIPTNTVRTSEPETEMVITQKEYEAFVGDAPKNPSKTTGARRAQAPVTDEKLKTTKKPSVASLEKPVSEKKRAERRDSLSIYKDSLAAYRSANYADALTGFQAFLESKPRADYVDNALYWIGECQFGLGDYNQAISFFHRVVHEQPDGNKVPDAMLKMSLAFEQLGRSEDAKKTLEQLTSQYPATNAGQMGKKKLNSH